MNEQGQYKEVMRTFNKEVKELREKVETVGTDAIQKFKTALSFIDSCADYYGTGFDDCLKQVVSAFLELDLFGISMDALSR